MSLRVQILVRLGYSIVPVLVSSLRGDNVGRKAWALWILGEIGDPVAAREVAWLLTDPHLGWLAGRSLTRMGEPGLEELLRYVSSPPTDASAVRAVEALALFEDARAWDALEAAVAKPIPRAARVRCAVLLSVHGDVERVDRLREYLDTEGDDLWPDVRSALRDEGQIR
jgi:HEAT repeat protein